MTQRKDERTVKTGRRIRYVRTLLEMTQQEMADRTGLTKSCISRIESGKSMSAENLLAVLAFLSPFVRIDMMLEDGKWESAVIEEDAMIRNSSMESIMEAKLEAMKVRMQKNIQTAKNEVSRALNMLSRQMVRSTDSAKALIERH